MLKGLIQHMMYFDLHGSIQIEYTLAKTSAEPFWQLLQEEEYASALGALTGTQAIQQVQAGLKAIYCSGWQVAAIVHHHSTGSRISTMRQ